MNLHDKKWTIKPSRNTDIEDLNINPLVKKILVNRGFDTTIEAENFLFPKLENLYDPFLLKDMDKVIKRIRKAIENDESIWIYGDYDVDGITSISVLIKGFEYLGLKLNYYIPNRLEEGYGISVAGLDKILDKGADLIISVDCGITSVKEVEYVKEHNKDIIITDHHNCQDEIPDAYAIINPKQSDCDYPFDMLAGVGIAMKIVQALIGDEEFIDNYDIFLDITSLGTVADIAPIVDENRIITKFGLVAIENTRNIGLKALLEVSDLVNKPVTAGNIGFSLGPKINAAGRIGKPELGVELLTSKNHEQALEIARDLDELNKERQELEKQILEQIEGLIEEQVDITNDKIFVILGDAWHTGVIGIVASRISEKYHRPSIILSTDGEIAKGSARSVGDISIFDALNDCKDLFLGFGGHKQAAGLSLNLENVEAFRRQINAYAHKNITDEELIPNVKIDSVIHSNEISYETIDDLEKLEPHGMGNPKPVFIYNNLSIDNIRMLGKQKEHIKLVLHDGTRTFEALAFRVLDKYVDLRSQDKLDLVMTLGKNSFRGIDTIQFMIKDIRRLESTYYKNTKIGKYFTKTLARSLFYNSIVDENQMNVIPSVSFGQSIKYSYDNIDRLDYVTRQCGIKRLVIVQSFTSLLEIIFRIDDEQICGNSIGINYASISNSKEIDILVNPIIKNIDYTDYNEVVIYDLLHSRLIANQVEDKCNCDITYFSRPSIDEKEQSKSLYTAIPHRMDLVDVYKFLLSEKEGLSISLEDFSKILNMDLIKCELSLRILENLSLISIKEDEDYHILVLPKPDKKVPLDQTSIYQKISSIRDKFSDYINEIKEIKKTQV